MPVCKAIAEKDGVLSEPLTSQTGFYYFITQKAILMMRFIIARRMTSRKELNYLKTQKHYIIGYVIMPGHVQVIIAFKQNRQTIKSIISNGRRLLPEKKLYSRSLVFICLITPTEQLAILYVYIKKQQ